MPRVELSLCDRVYVLKLISTVQMTSSSFLTILYVYLIDLQKSVSIPDTRADTMNYKWCVVAVSIVDFGLGTLLAFAANMEGIRCRRRIIIWIIFETILIPLSIFFLMQLYYKMKNAKQNLITDPHYSRMNLVQVGFFLCHYFFITYAVDFLVTWNPIVKCYNPNIRPKSVYEPTDPKITTTESRHIPMSESFISRPSSSEVFISKKKVDKKK